ncbi:MAG: hypothetical protein JST30_16785 [Armatimonadetes bacterium]|nr:hypothetical protein [Armatimonadota bacterium]
MRHVWGALRLLVKTPALWPLAALPLVSAVVAYLALLALGFWAVVPRLTAAGSKFGLPDTVGWLTGSTLFALVWVLVSGPLFMILFSLIAVPVWDRLTAKVESLCGVPDRGTAFSVRFLARDLPPRACFALGAACAALVFGWLGFGLVGAALGGWVMLYDLTAPSCARRGTAFLQQPGFVHRRQGWLGLWTVSSLVTLVPGLNVLCLPTLVTAGTLLVVEGERRGAVATGP